jgi:hypothetical protein
MRPVGWSAFLAFDDIIRQLIRVCRHSWKIRGQHFADFANRFRDCVAEFFILKMNAHSIHNVLPELVGASFVDRFVANNSELVRAWRYKNQHSIALAGFVHSQSLKFFLRNDQRIGAQFAALNINANLAGGFCFSIANRLDDAVMLKLA